MWLQLAGVGPVSRQAWSLHSPGLMWRTCMAQDACLPLEHCRLEQPCLTRPLTMHQCQMLKLPHAAVCGCSWLALVQCSIRHGRSSLQNPCGKPACPRMHAGLPLERCRLEHPCLTRPLTMHKCQMLKVPQAAVCGFNWLALVQCPVRHGRSTLQDSCGKPACPRMHAGLPLER